MPKQPVKKPAPRKTAKPKPKPKSKPKRKTKPRSTNSNVNTVRVVLGRSDKAGSAGHPPAISYSLTQPAPIYQTPAGPSFVDNPSTLDPKINPRIKTIRQAQSSLPVFRPRTSIPPAKINIIPDTEDEDEFFATPAKQRFPAPVSPVSINIDSTYDSDIGKEETPFNPGATPISITSISDENFATPKHGIPGVSPAPAAPTISSVEPAPPKPALKLEKTPVLEHPLENDATPVKKRGRPKGSKSKPKPPPIEAVAVIPEAQPLKNPPDWGLSTPEQHIEKVLAPEATWNLAFNDNQRRNDTPDWSQIQGRYSARHLDKEPPSFTPQKTNLLPINESPYDPFLADDF